MKEYYVGTFYSNDKFCVDVFVGMEYKQYVKDVKYDQEDKNTNNQELS